jgi:hypothetical protein
VVLIETAGREHQVRQHGATDTPADLDRQIGQGVPPRQATERGIHKGHNRVEVGSADRPEHQDDREQPGGGSRRVLGQLQAGVVRREPLRGDS